MRSKLQHLANEVQKLPLPEQIELLNILSQSLHKNYVETQKHQSFWKPKTLEQHVDEQQTKAFTPVIAPDESFWPEEESMDEFLEYLQRERREDLLRSK